MAKGLFTVFSIFLYQSWVIQVTIQDVPNRVFPAEGGTTIVEFHLSQTCEVAKTESKT